MSELQKVKDELNSTGCGMCLAKWTQVTMHLHNGMTHSCHHPIPHKIPLEELKSNPTALHNTRFKKEKRREMLENKKPQECNYCWNVEDNSNSFSDRVFKSAEPWSLPFMKEIKGLDWRANYNPKYVEVSFSNTCNFKCAYCSPQFSSKWVEEVEKHGGYVNSQNFNDIEHLKGTNQLPYKHSEENPYVESFWNWWPELYNDLHTFRITGGEPLLSKDTWKILDFISDTESPNTKLNFSINSNLGVPRDLVVRLVEKAKKIMDEGKVNEFIIYTSCESWGKQSEYVRYGMDFDLYMDNLEYILTNLPRTNVVIMATFNALSVFEYEKLVDKVFELKKKYHSKQRYWPPAVQLDTSYLRWPAFLNVKILDKEHKEAILRVAKKAFYYSTKQFGFSNYGFSNIEVQKIKRIYDYSISEDGYDVEKNRESFVAFVDEYDKRRYTNFIDTFPQLKKLYYDVKNK